MAFACWRPGVDRCVHPRCGEPDARCFHWPEVPVDREPDRLNNVRLGLAGAPPPPRAALPAPPPPEPLQLADVDAFSLSPPVSQRPARSRRRK